MNVLKAARCYVEMVAGMVAGMILLEPLWPAAATAASTPVGSQAMVMATNMSIGMSAVMLLRRHGIRSTLLMCASMYAPFLVLLAPYGAGWLGADTYFTAGHLLMLVLMVALMHRSSPAPQPSAASTGTSALPASASTPDPAHHTTAPITEGSSS
jgi:hypothetical protein